MQTEEELKHQFKILYINNIIMYVIILLHLIVTFGVLENLKELESFSEYDKPLTQSVYTNE